ncbi:unnamed protein product [Musa textilis]
MEVYVDNMIVKSRTGPAHLTDLAETFATLRKYDMRLNPAKCTFGVSSGRFLGFIVHERGIDTNPEKYAVSSVLIKEASGEQLSVYYLSHILKGPEERYPPIEKLALTLVLAAQKLRPYFQTHPIEVIIDQPLRQVLLKFDVVGRLLKWSVELAEFDLQYKSRTAIKAHAVADFISELTRPEDGGSEQVVAEWVLRVVPAITSIRGKTVVFADGQSQCFDAIIFATGYKSSATNWDEGELSNQQGLRRQSFPQHWKGKNGVYFSGFSKKGLPGIKMEALNIAGDINMKDENCD